MMAHNPARQHPGAPGLGAPSGGSFAQRLPLAPGASPRPSATPSRTTPSRFGRLGGVFKYKFYSRAELEETSRRQGSRGDGMDAALEKRRRKNYVAWMTELISELYGRGKAHIVLSTAIIYMHRYFALKSMLKTDIWLMGLAALFTASKSENLPLPLDHIIAAVLRVRRNGELVVNSFKPPLNKRLARVRSSPERQRLLRDWVLTAERALLYTLGFKFMVLHPHTTVLNVASKYKLESFMISRPGMPKPEVPVVPQCAVETLNIVSSTTLSLQYKPETLGIACLEFALRELAKTSPPRVKRVPLLQTGQHWWEEAGATAAEIQDIHSQILDELNVPEPEPAVAPVPARPPGAHLASSGASSKVSSTTAVAVHSPTPQLPVIDEEGGSAHGGRSSGVPTPAGAAPAPAAGSPDNGSDASAMTGTAATPRRGDADAVISSAAPPPAAAALAGRKRASPDGTSGRAAAEPLAKRASPERALAGAAPQHTSIMHAAEAVAPREVGAVAGSSAAPPAAAAPGLAAAPPFAGAEHVPKEPAAARPSFTRAADTVAPGEGGHNALGGAQLAAPRGPH